MEKSEVDGVCRGYRQLLKQAFLESRWIGKRVAAGVQMEG